MKGEEKKTESTDGVLERRWMRRKESREAASPLALLCVSVCESDFAQPFITGYITTGG